MIMEKMPTSLREFLQILESEELLVRVKNEVNPEPDIGAAGRAAANSIQKPAIFLENKGI